MINKSTMSNELNRIRELSGLQQEAPASVNQASVAEAPASSDQALAKDLANHFMKKANSFKTMIK